MISVVGKQEPRNGNLTICQALYQALGTQRQIIYGPALQEFEKADRQTTTVSDKSITEVITNSTRTHGLGFKGQKRVII